MLEEIRETTLRSCQNPDDFFPVSWYNVDTGASCEISIADFAARTYITLCMAFLAHLSMKPETNALKVSIIKTASPIKEKVHFCYYRLTKGVNGILSYAKEGVRLWFRTKRPTFRQLCLKLVV